MTLDQWFCTLAADPLGNVYIQCCICSLPRNSDCIDLWWGPCLCILFPFFCFESFPDEANVQPEWSLFLTLRVNKTMCHDKTFRTITATVRKSLLLISGTKHFYWNIIFVIQIPITKKKKILSGTLLYVR